MNVEELDNPAFFSLTRHHRHLAEFDGSAARYRASVSPFFALPTRPSQADWRAAGALVGAAGGALIRDDTDLPEGWEQQVRLDAAQLIAADPIGRRSPEVVRLTRADVPEMIELARRAKPGPFEEDTVSFGGYLGIRTASSLVAMGGQRLQVDGATEISAIATDPAHRGHGYASTIVRAVAADIEEQGNTPFLHVTSGNPARRLYESLGFTVRRTIVIREVRYLGS